MASLVRQFAKMPGIGTKTAQRLALHLLRGEPEAAERLGQLILVLRERVRFCGRCGGITEQPECAICTDPTRNREVVCVVEEPQDVLVIENTNRYKGLYHVLHGVLSPIDGVGPEKLTLGDLESRVDREGLKEVIVATNPTVEGDTTALYIARALANRGCSVTRLARGLPMGGTLEFTDDVTLARALERREQL